MPCMYTSVLMRAFLEENGDNAYDWMDRRVAVHLWMAEAEEIYFRRWQEIECLQTVSTTIADED